MESKRLLLSFKNEDGNKVSLSLDGPKADLTEESVKAAMNDIITSDIFHSNGGKLVSAVGAAVITTVNSEFF